ncbi:MAG: hypothetical protein ISP49_01000 [Reyranella sp.]|jgi:hypothetical protein|nr:hypothetical protein [Reyranella sp.]MBL6650139.1 hypothetical protein [Reyranella sp.]
MSEQGTPLLAVVLRTLAAVAGVAAANAGRRVAVAAAGYLVVAGLFVASLCFLTLAGYRAIALALGDVYAALIVGCAYLGVGLLVALFLAIRRR